MKRHSFTLIELLIVIAIIGVLSSLIFVAYRPVRESVRRTTAKQECVSIETALLTYYSDFYQWPGQSGKLSNALNKLMGQNDRDKYYLEANRSYTESNGQNYYDPWDRDYNIEISASGNTYFTPSGGANVYKKCGVWSYGGPEGDEGNFLYDAYHEGRAVTSWK